jgi:hypothetical protein
LSQYTRTEEYLQDNAKSCRNLFKIDKQEIRASHKNVLRRISISKKEEATQNGKNYTMVSETSGSHSSEDIHVGLLGCNIMWTCRHKPMFWRNILSPFSGLHSL